MHIVTDGYAVLFNNRNAIVSVRIVSRNYFDYRMDIRFRVAPNETF